MSVACQKGAMNESPDVEKMNAGFLEEVVEAESVSGSVPSHSKRAGWSLPK